jgi:hypothetical protein
MEARDRSLTETRAAKRSIMVNTDAFCDDEADAALGTTSIIAADVAPPARR